MKTNKSIKKKFFYSFILTIMLPLVIFAFSSYYLIGQNIIETTNEHYESIINKVRENIENQMAEIERLAVQYSNLTWVNEIMMVNDLEGRVTTWELYSYNQDLVTLEVISDTFDEIAIVFHDKDLALSSVRLSEMEYFKKYTFKIKGWNDSDWQEIISEKNSQKIIYDTVLASDNVGGREGLLVVNSIPVNVNRSRATILAFIEYDNIRKEIKDVCLNEDVSVYLMNSENKSIVSYNEKGDLPDEFIDELPVGNDEFTSLVTLSNNTYIETLPELGWKIVALVPEQYICKKCSANVHDFADGADIDDICGNTPFKLHGEKTI